MAGWWEGEEREGEGIQALNVMIAGTSRLNSALYIFNWILDS